VNVITGSTAATRPPTPIGLSAVAVSATQINLTFVAGGTQAAFRIFRINGPSGQFVPVTQPVGQVAGTVTIFSDTTVAPGTTYTYEVVATSSTGDSIPSVPFVVTSLPPAPVLTAMAISQSQIALTLNTGGVTVSGFTFERATNGGLFQPITPTAGANSTTFIDTGLTVGTTYIYRARASNVSGSSAVSSTVTVTTLADSITGIVTAFSAVTPTPLVGVTVQLINVLGNPAAQTVTNAAGSYRFTGLADGSYTVRLIAPGQTTPVTAAVTTNSTVNNGVATVNLAAAPITQFPAGLSMISLPYDYTSLGTDAASIIGTTNIATYHPIDPSNPTNPLGNTYLLYPQLPGTKGNQILPGRGYWIGEFTAQPLLTAGLPVSTPFSISLLPGWNMIGDPYTSSIDLNTLFYSLPVPVGSFAANSLIPFTSAGANNLVRLPLFTYSPPTTTTIGQYVTATSINPFTGYWMYIDPVVSHNTAVTLTFTNPGS
ncbi:MAG: carboxypeptidase regulatory-like domain-containing protein, partial [Armatimonadota bacterium]|nr:carboxypeptidase regulatory-like domain-containing protein [Armatimonadota bacterium]